MMIVHLLSLWLYQSLNRGLSNIYGGDYRLADMLNIKPDLGHISLGRTKY